MGAYTLCEPCNNSTGRWYGRSYAEFTKQALEIVKRLPPDLKTVRVVLHDIYPLRLLKQIITMVFSVNTAKFQTLHPELVRFVLDKTSKTLPDKYMVHMTLLRRTGLLRSSGVTGILNTNTGSMRFVSEVAFPPVACLIDFGASQAGIPGDITPYRRFNFDELADRLELTMAVGEVNTPYPSDYADQAELGVRRQLADQSRPKGESS